jgi:hypothetical protein
VRCGRAAEQLVGLSAKASSNSVDAKVDTAKVKESGGFEPRARRVASERAETGTEPDDDEDSDQDDDALLLARSYFDTREYRRAAHALQGASGRKATFLRFYATYLVIKIFFWHFFCISFSAWIAELIFYCIGGFVLNVELIGASSRGFLKFSQNPV